MLSIIKNIKIILFVTFSILFFSTLVFAAKVNIAPSCNGGCVGLGSSGANVKFIQQMLGVKPDGQFGPDTQKALMKWQKEHGIQADGYFGAQTSAQMKQDFTATRDGQVKIQDASNNSFGSADKPIQNVQSLVNTARPSQSVSDYQKLGTDLATQRNNLTLVQNAMRNPDLTPEGVKKLEVQAQGIKDEIGKLEGSRDKILDDYSDPFARGTESNGVTLATPKGEGDSFIEKFYKGPDPVVIDGKPKTQAELEATPFISTPGNQIWERFKNWWTPPSTTPKPEGVETKPLPPNPLPTTLAELDSESKKLFDKCNKGAGCSQEESERLDALTEKMNNLQGPNPSEKPDSTPQPTVPEEPGIIERLQNFLSPKTEPKPETKPDNPAEGTPLVNPEPFGSPTNIPSPSQTPTPPTPAPTPPPPGPGPSTGAGSVPPAPTAPPLTSPQQPGGISPEQLQTYKDQNAALQVSSMDKTISTLKDSVSDYQEKVKSFGKEGDVESQKFYQSMLDQSKADLQRMENFRNDLVNGNTDKNKYGLEDVVAGLTNPRNKPEDFDAKNVDKVTKCAALAYNTNLMNGITTIIPNTDNPSLNLSHVQVQKVDPKTRKVEPDSFIQNGNAKGIAPATEGKPLIPQKGQVKKMNGELVCCPKVAMGASGANKGKLTCVGYNPAGGRLVSGNYGAATLSPPK